MLLQYGSMCADRTNDSGRPRSILVILPTWVGDFVMATPTLRAIRERFAQAHITLLGEPNLRAVAMRSPD